MGVLYPDTLSGRESNRTRTDNWVVELGDLVTLGRVRIEVVFAIKGGVGINFCVHSGAGTDGELNGFAV